MLVHVTNSLASFPITALLAFLESALFAFLESALLAFLVTSFIRMLFHIDNRLAHIDFISCLAELNICTRACIDCLYCFK